MRNKKMSARILTNILMMLHFHENVTKISYTSFPVSHLDPSHPCGAYGVPCVATPQRDLLLTLPLPPRPQV